MINGHRVLGVVPARGGSQRVPRKNLRQIAGRPLLAWTIAAGRKSQLIDRLIVSSDDDEIIATARQEGCEAPFVRPAELARNDTPGIAPALHAIEMLPGHDYVVLLQPTSPLRDAEDIDGCIRRCVDSGANACVTVSKADKNPYWMFTLDGNGKMRPLLGTAERFERSQEPPHVFALNGAVYVARSAWLRDSGSFVTADTLAYVMPHERSLDIDTEFDLIIAETLLREKNRAQT